MFFLLRHMYFWDSMYGRTANLAVFLADLRAVNGFDEAMVGYGAEDTDIIQRLNNLGLKRNYAKCMAVCYHLYHKRLTMTKTNFKQYERNHQLVRCVKGMESFGS